MADPMTTDPMLAAPPQGAAPPAPSAPPSPDQVAQMEVEAQQANIDAMLAARPQPEKPFQLEVLQRLEKALDSFSDALAKAVNKEMEKGEEIEFKPIAWDPAADPEGVLNGDSWEGPVPGILFIPVMAVLDLIKQVQGGAFKDKLKIDAEQLGSETGVKIVAGQIAKAASNQPFIDAAVDMLGGEMETDEAEPPARSPSEPTEADAAVVDAMG